ncbi:D-glycero-beta-D-manno-heptose 1,7-bisphosphate 7-phosphatase [Nitratiruptor sp. SB155-2]|uniref:D-glycero-beta-D-manno-heptose 1,7-bisphosphate 7-phosphatase n=1 Tax=Nitratiruptor sp. (strain SB155-2) TaxID=387092 RepID=UPI00015870BC|nr:D-glycero-beta-D-manno-heptose 1,7-bisphosphate 7-phosphatase [Nitratiruptor sp. SB155-2]BAF70557.1 D-glycero-D-manno-heptose 1,7-bisphosphate phosphatase [Nitratiruptor sp. SB155-2]
MKAVFLDRDGVINEDSGYVHTIQDFHFLPGVFEALKHFQNLGYHLFIVTNQSGIGRGYYTQDDFYSLSAWMVNQLKKRGITIDKIYHCPHHPDMECTCRKPMPGMLLKAIDEFEIDPKKSWMIGDKLSDIEAAKGAGIENTIIIGSDRGAKYQVTSLFDTINIIKQ